MIYIEHSLGLAMHLLITEYTQCFRNIASNFIYIYLIYLDIFAAVFTSHNLLQKNIIGSLQHKKHSSVYYTSSPTSWRNVEYLEWFVSFNRSLQTAESQVSPPISRFTLYMIVASSSPVRSSSISRRLELEMLGGDLTESDWSLIL